jgi:hypothetical protein
MFLGALLPLLLLSFLPFCWGREMVFGNHLNLFLPHLTVKYILQKDGPWIFCSFADSLYRIGTVPTPAGEAGTYVLLGDNMKIWHHFVSASRRGLGTVRLPSTWWHFKGTFLSRFLEESFFFLPKTKAKRQVVLPPSFTRGQFFSGLVLH